MKSDVNQEYMTAREAVASFGLGLFVIAPLLGIGVVVTLGDRLLSWALGAQHPGHPRPYYPSRHMMAANSDVELPRKKRKAA